MQPNLVCIGTVRDPGSRQGPEASLIAVTAPFRTSEQQSAA
jgi:hypothetical protein